MDEKNETVGIEPIPDLAPTLDAEGNDITDWKAEAEKRDKLARQRDGLARRNLSDLEKLKKEKEKPPQSEPGGQKQGFDYAEKVYLIQGGVPKEFHDFAWEVYKTTGAKDLDDLLGKKHFIAEVKARQEEAAKQEALPDQKGRGGTGTSDTVEYYLAKGGLPPLDQPMLRRQVVQARRKQAEDTHKFTPNPTGKLTIG